jgi:hypothetical protein
LNYCSKITDQEDNPYSDESRPQGDPWDEDYAYNDYIAGSATCESICPEYGLITECAECEGPAETDLCYTYQNYLNLTTWPEGSNFQDFMNKSFSLKCYHLSDSSVATEVIETENGYSLCSRLNAKRHLNPRSRLFDHYKPVNLTYIDGDGILRYGRMLES